MQREQLNLTEGDGYEALKGHVCEKATAARKRYGTPPTLDKFREMLRDGDIVRHPTELVFDSSALLEGEPAISVMQEGSSPRTFRLFVHESFRGRDADVVMLAAYHIPSINYLDIVTHEEAELFGSTLHGMEIEAYYERICELADELGDAPKLSPNPFESVGGCGTGCGCHG